MLIKKRVQGKDIILDYKQIKTYPHGYTRYRVYKVFTKRKFLYTTCLTSLQLEKIKQAGYVIFDEEELE